MDNVNYKKLTRKYYFSVEGETEKWYFERLQYLINRSENNIFTVKFDIKVEKSILKRAKSISLFYPIELFHICDYESNEDMHIELFRRLLDDIKNVRSLRPDILCKLGYSNFTFELWLILHKIDCYSSMQHRKEYIKFIDIAFKRKFSVLENYKSEKVIRDLLDDITFPEVLSAITRAEKIRNDHVGKNDNIIEYKKFSYYKNNPDLTVHECVKKILSDCKIIP